MSDTVKQVTATYTCGMSWNSSYDTHLLKQQALKSMDKFTLSRESRPMGSTIIL